MKSDSRLIRIERAGDREPDPALADEVEMGLAVVEPMEDAALRAARLRRGFVDGTGVEVGHRDAPTSDWSSAAIASPR